MFGHYPLVDDFLNSHYLSPCQSTKIVRRIYLLVTPWNDRVNMQKVTYFSVSIRLSLTQKSAQNTSHPLTLKDV